MHADIGRSPKVFIAYAQDSQAHKDNVRGLADLLRSNGVDAEIDQYAEDERRDWNAWAIKYFTDADYVVIVASPRMGAYGDGNAPADQNRGVQAEMTVIRDLLQSDRPLWTKKILPVLLSGSPLDRLPKFLAPYSLSHYRVDDLTDHGIEDLLRVITDQPKVARPDLGPIPQLPPRPPFQTATAAPAEPDWQVLPEPVPVMWRTEIMSTGDLTMPNWSATLEVHLAPADGTTRLPVSWLRTIGGRLAGIMRERGLVPTTEALHERLSEQIVQVSYHDSRTDAGAGLAALRNGQRSAWQALPRAQIGSVLIPDEAMATISTMIEVLLAIDNAQPDRFVPTAGIEPVDFVRVGERSDLASNSASLPMATTRHVRTDAEESLTVRDLTQLDTLVAKELTERLVAAFPKW